MALPITTCDVQLGRNVVEYDASWRPTRQPDWFDKLCSKLKSLFENKPKTEDTQNLSNLDKV